MNANDILTGQARFGAALTLSARTATTVSDDLDAGPYGGIIVYLHVSAITDTPSITLTIQGKDEIADGYFTLLTGAAVTTVTTAAYKVFPGATASANLIANDAVPRTFRISVAHGNTDSITYRVSYCLIP